MKPSVQQLKLRVHDELVYDATDRKHMQQLISNKMTHKHNDQVPAMIQSPKPQPDCNAGVGPQGRCAETNVSKL